MTTDNSSASVIERVLAYATIAIIAIALLAFFATLIVGLNGSADLAEGFWPYVFGITIYGLPTGFALLIALIITAQVRRSRAAKKSRKA
ncbi:hypothetical protein [Leucobacter sp. 1207-22]|uniref:hypothetical protein n=1 Tax=Leucobacter sp. 1207-22 TaxID=2604456 RepID=UPI0040636481